VSPTALPSSMGRVVDRTSSIKMMPGWSKMVGLQADLNTLGKRAWSRARWASEPAADDGGACYMAEEIDGMKPDSSRQWFFCSDPSDDENMMCELVPEWMGSAPDGGHAVWLCSTPKVSAADAPADA